MRLDAVLDRQRGAVAEALELGRPLLAFHMGVAAGVEFHDCGAEAKRCIDLALRRFDEQADTHTRVAKPSDIGA